MKPTLILAAVLAAVLAQSAAAQPAACTRPAAPGPVDGATATIDQMKAGKEAAGAFMTASDEFQTCVLADLDAKKKAAKAAKTKVDPAVSGALNDAITANQNDKVAVGDAFNGAVRAFKAAHPPAPAPTPAP